MYLVIMQLILFFSNDLYPYNFKASGGGVGGQKKKLLCKTMLKGPNFKGIIPKVDKNNF